MKRKRKHKKSKAKKVSAASVTKPAISSSLNTETNSGLDEFDKRNDSAAMEIDSDQPQSVASPNPNRNPNPNPNPEGSISKGVIGKPLKVKLKTPKVTESQLTSSDAPTQSATDKSAHQMGFEKQLVAAEKTEDSANSSKDLGPKIVPPHKEQKTPLQGPRRYDKQELDTALTVIQKVMKMDASEPFNVPVNPVALGIPDYFDVIDTPMDFGTICTNIESGAKYANSEDVYRDVQYIWDNCFKYNSKGDYILDLMKRVKKNFAKLWTIAGLYSEQSVGSNGIESSQEKIGTTGPIKVYVKGGLSKKTSKKGHGRRHKSDCLCAICVLKRRRREREENERIAQGLVGEASLGESPSGDNSASDMDESPLDQDAGTEVKNEESKQTGHSLEDKEEDDDSEENDDNEEEEEEEEERDIEMKDKNNNGEQTEHSNKQTLQELTENSNDGIQSDTQRDDPVIQLGDSIEPPQQHRHKDVQEKRRKLEALQMKLKENPMVLNLCGALFPDKTKKSIWSGPHSIDGRCPIRNSSTSYTSIHAAIDMLMKRTN